GPMPNSALIFARCRSRSFSGRPDESTRRYASMARERLASLISLMVAMRRPLSAFSKTAGERCEPTRVGSGPRGSTRGWVASETGQARSVAPADVLERSLTLLTLLLRWAREGHEAGLRFLEVLAPAHVGGVLEH